MVTKNENSIIGTEQIEETAAADTLKPSNTTKSSLLSQMIKIFAGMKKEDLSSFLTQTLSQVGKEDETVPNHSAANKASIEMKPGTTPAPSAITGAIVREDVQAMFGDQDLSEEFKEKALTIFEAAVNMRVDAEVTRIQEEAEARIQEEIEKQVTASIDELHAQVEKYMSYVADTWLEQNEVAIESNLKSAMVEDFIGKVINVFKESYIDIPEDKVDIISDIIEENETLNAKLEAALAEKIELENTIRSNSITAVFAKVSEGLTDTQSEKLKSLSESLESFDLEDYENKLTIIKEQYFNDDQEKKSSTGLINEDSVGNNDEPADNEKPAYYNPEVAKYAQVISKTTKR